MIKANIWAMKGLDMWKLYNASPISGHKSNDTQKTEHIIYSHCVQLWVEKLLKCTKRITYF